MLRALIFDFDGVIADTEPVHLRAFQSVLAGIVPVPRTEEYFRDYVGLKDERFVELLFQQAGRPLDADERLRFVAEKKKAFARLIDAELTPIPGVEDFVRRVHRRWPLAICSGAFRDEIDHVLARFDLANCFSAIVSAESVPSSKPDPAGFSLACKLLGIHAKDLRPIECLAFEDSAHGVAAAKAAGLRVVLIVGAGGAATNADADAAVPDFRAVSDQKLLEWFQKR